jgi:aminoglycoside phosphotransferase (APT) family kinase protein
MMRPMGRPKMHAEEVETDADLVRRLLAGQFPHWADLPIELVDSYGTDHDIYRVGDELSVRLPRIGWATGQAAKEAEWLPKLAPHLPLAVPAQLALGDRAEGYPYVWSVYAWLPGENANGTIADLEQAGGFRPPAHPRAARGGAAHRWGSWTTASVARSASSAAGSTPRRRSPRGRSH